MERIDENVEAREQLEHLQIGWTASVLLLELYRKAEVRRASFSCNWCSNSSCPFCLVSICPLPANLPLEDSKPGHKSTQKGCLLIFHLIKNLLFWKYSTPQESTASSYEAAVIYTIQNDKILSNEFWD